MKYVVLVLVLAVAAGCAGMKQGGSRSSDTGPSRSMAPYGQFNNPAGVLGR